MIYKLKIIQAIESNKVNVEKIPAHFKNERDIALSIALHSPDGLNHVSFRLRNDLFFTKMVLKKYPEAIKYCSKRVKNLHAKYRKK